MKRRNPKAGFGHNVVLYFRNRMFVDRKKQQNKYACRRWNMKSQKFRLIIGSILLVSSTFFLSGCFSMGAMSAVSEVASVYRSARAITQGYYAYNMTKALKDAEPIFEDYNAVRIELLLRPREVNAEKLVNAFKDNVHYIIKKDLKAVGLTLKICEKDNCSNRTMVIQFKEDGYGSNFLKKVLIGDRLRGRLYFLDGDTSTVIKEEPLEVAKNYKDLIVEIHMSIASKAIKTLEKKGDEERLRKAIDKINSIDPIKDEYKELFRSH